MAFSCGFYNAIDHDRVYDANQFGEMFDGLINDGIYATIGNCFAVVSGNGIQVKVRSGRAWFNKTWSVNTTDLPLTLEMPDLLMPRIDAIVLEVDTRVIVRNNALKVITGATAVNPVKPTLIKADGLYQYPLAYVTVDANASTIAASKIENCVGNVTPFCTGILKSVSIEELWNQWKAQFDTWFAGIKAQLDGDVATNLLGQIENLKDTKVNVSAKATTAQAQAGTNDTTWMTPLKVQQWYTSKVKPTIDTLTTNQSYTYDEATGLKYKSALSPRIIVEPTYNESIVTIANTVYSTELTAYPIVIHNEKMLDRLYGTNATYARTYYFSEILINSSNKLVDAMIPSFSNDVLISTIVDGYDVVFLTPSTASNRMGALIFRSVTSDGNANNTDWIAGVKIGSKYGVVASTSSVSGTHFVYASTGNIGTSETISSSNRTDIDLGVNVTMVLGVVGNFVYYVYVQNKINYVGRVDISTNTVTNNLYSLPTSYTLLSLMMYNDTHAYIFVNNGSRNGCLLLQLSTGSTYFGAYVGDMNYSSNDIIATNYFGKIGNVVLYYDDFYISILNLIDTSLETYAIRNIVYGSQMPRSYYVSASQAYGFIDGDRRYFSGTRYFNSVMMLNPNALPRREKVFTDPKIQRFVPLMPRLLFDMKRKRVKILSYDQYTMAASSLPEGLGINSNANSNNYTDVAVTIHTPSILYLDTVVSNAELITMYRYHYSSSSTGATAATYDVARIKIDSTMDVIADV